MKPLQITLFLIANLIFITQAGRDVHQVFLGAQACEAARAMHVFNGLTSLACNF
jgi:hypothetical protein